MLFPIIIYISLSFANYEIGDTFSMPDQQITHEICYGEYENDIYISYESLYKSIVNELF